MTQRSAASSSPHVIQTSFISPHTLEVLHIHILLRDRVGTVDGAPVRLAHIEEVRPESPHAELDDVDDGLLRRAAKKEGSDGIVTEVDDRVN